ncbi:MAG TPA: hypothetical protein VFX52_06920, partial [Nocardioidaceae bacterium]|nr:hypothetical protein [Nocardioidaceae bacterium]
PERPGDLAWRLVLDAMIFQSEAEIRWLDHCEVSLVRHNPPPASPASPFAPGPVDAAEMAAADPKEVAP